MRERFAAAGQIILMFALILNIVEHERVWVLILLLLLVANILLNGFLGRKDD